MISVGDSDDDVGRLDDGGDRGRDLVTRTQLHDRLLWIVGGIFDSISDIVAVPSDVPLEITAVTTLPGAQRGSAETRDTAYAS